MRPSPSTKESLNFISAQLTSFICDLSQQDMENLQSGTSLGIKTHNDKSPILLSSNRSLSKYSISMNLGELNDPNFPMGNSRYSLQFENGKFVSLKKQIIQCIDNDPDKKITQLSDVSEDNFPNIIRSCEIFLKRFNQIDPNDFKRNLFNFYQFLSANKISEEVLSSFEIMLSKDRNSNVFIVDSSNPDNKFEIKSDLLSQSLLNGGKLNDEQIKQIKINGDVNNLIKNILKFTNEIIKPVPSSVFSSYGSAGRAAGR